MKNKLSIILRFGISFGLLFLLIWIMRKDAKEVIDIFKSSDKKLILLAIFINILSSVAVAYRLILVMAGQKILLKIKDAIYLTFIGCFFNNFLPTAIGGDIAKAYYASKRTNNKVASYAAVLADRLLGLIATLLVALIGLLFIGKSINNTLITWLVLFVFILVVLAIAWLLKKNNRVEKISFETKGIFNKIKEKLLKLYKAINLYRNSPGILVKALALSLLLQSLSIVGIYLFISCIDGNIPLFRLFLMVPLVWAVSMLPSLNGLGVREGAFVYFFKGYIGPEKAFAVSLLWLGMIMMNSLIGGVYQLVYPVKIEGGSIND